jgi:recombination protein RecA
VLSIAEKTILKAKQFKKDVPITIIWDSVAASSPKAELIGDYDKETIGLNARVIPKGMRKITGVIANQNVLFVILNQTRTKIGVMFGNPETTTGGNALKFYASVRLDIRRIGAVKKGEEVLGNQTRVKVVKNKVAPPFRKAEFDILYNEGISKEGELIDMGVEHQIVDKSGAWYSYNGERIGQGRDNVRDFLRSNPDIASDIENVVRQKMGLDSLGSSDVSAPESAPAKVQSAES